MMKRFLNKNVQYLRVEEEIRKKILSGEYPEGEALPGELPLCQEYGVSRKTLRKALNILETRNYIRKYQGSGNFVIPASERAGMPRITGKICVMLPAEKNRNSFAGELLAGIYKAASGLSVGIRILPHETPVSVLLEMYRNFECDAFIWGANPEKLPAAIYQFARMKIPQVVINGKVDGAGAILYDSFPAWRALLNAFSACGHKNTVFIERNEKHLWTHFRQQAFLKAAGEFGMNGTVFKTGVKCAGLAELISSHPEITAFITAKPLSGAFLKIIAKADKKIPRDISWAEFSFNGIDGQQEVTRICIPAQRMGEEAVRLLLTGNFSEPEIHVPCFSVMGLSFAGCNMNRSSNKNNKEF